MPSAHSHLTSSAQARTVNAIDKLLALADESLSPAVVEHLREGAARVGQARFNLVVLGEFKRGKSTLTMPCSGARCCRRVSCR